MPKKSPPPPMPPPSSPPPTLESLPDDVLGEIATKLYSTEVHHLSRATNTTIRPHTSSKGKRLRTPKSFPLPYRVQAKVHIYALEGNVGINFDIMKKQIVSCLYELSSFEGTHSRCLVKREQLRKSEYTSFDDKMESNLFVKTPGEKTRLRKQLQHRLDQLHAATQRCLVEASAPREVRDAVYDTRATGQTTMPLHQARSECVWNAEFSVEESIFLRENSKFVTFMRFHNDNLQCTLHFTVHNVGYVQIKWVPREPRDIFNMDVHFSPLRVTPTTQTGMERSEEVQRNRDDVRMFLEELYMHHMRHIVGYMRTVVEALPGAPVLNAKWESFLDGIGSQIPVLVGKYFS